MSTIQVELPDGSKKEMPAGANAMDVAMAISEGLARQVVVAKVDGAVTDVRTPLSDGQTVELFKADSPEGTDTLRHSCEHILATAVVTLFKGAQVTMGPRKHDDVFYYDFDIGRPFTPEDLEKIEAEMKKLIKAKTEFTLRELTKPEALELFNELGQTYKPQILEWIPDDIVSIYTSGAFVDLCRGPHIPHAGLIKSFKLLGVSGAYWRADSNNEMLQRISGIAFAKKDELKEYLHVTEEAKRRDHRKIGKELELFSVSERQDNHDYSAEEARLLVTGTASESVEALDLAFVTQLSAKVGGLLGRPVKLDRVDIQPRDVEDDKGLEVTARLFASGVNKEQRDGLTELATELSGEKRAIRVMVDPVFSEDIGAGLVLWLPKGGRVRTIIEDQWRKMHFEGGYEIVYSPHIARSDLWKVSGHWDFYRDSMFSPMAIDGQEYVAKPMNCPFHIMMFKSRGRSYRELPFRWAELGTVYRYEMAGVMHGLMRVRGFTQDDAHIFCRWDQLDEELDRVMGFILKVLKTFGFDEFEVNVSTRPEKFVGAPDQWAKAEASLEAAVKRYDLPYVIDEGGGAFYGPKIDVKLKDCLGRMWQCSTLQLDFNNPERFHLEFINNEGKPEQPVMLHRALLGSIERFFGILVEQYAGAFPLWLAPEQVRVITIADRHYEYAKKVGDALQAMGLRVDVPTTSDKLGAKIRQAQLEKIPVMLVVGDKEEEQGGAAVRLRDGTDKGFMALDALGSWLSEEAAPPQVD